MKATKYKFIMSRLTDISHELRDGTVEDRAVLNYIDNAIQELKRQRDLENPWESVVFINKLKECIKDPSFNFIETGKKTFLITKEVGANVVLNYCNPARKFIKQKVTEDSGQIVEAMTIGVGNYSLEFQKYTEIVIELRLELSMKAIQSGNYDENITILSDKIQCAFSDDFVL